MLGFKRQKPFPSAPNKFKNFIFRHLTDYHLYVYDQYDYVDTYNAYLEEFAKRIPNETQIETIKKRIRERLVDYEVNMYEQKIISKEYTIQEVESDIRIGIEYEDFVDIEIGYHLLKHLEEWKKKYGAKDKQWQAFTKDTQNVHTKVVSDQMNDSLHILLSIPVPRNQKTLDEIATAFANEVYTEANIGLVYKDMKQWGNTSEIFQANDYLYRRALRGLWAKIQTYEGETRKELIKRLWEECLEATGLCATGHISRLSNVLVGFDEKFQPQVSIQEMFQNAMANISKMDRTIEEKHTMARKVMDEMKIALEERETWLEAL